MRQGVGLTPDNCQPTSLFQFLFNEERKGETVSAKTCECRASVELKRVSRALHGMLYLYEAEFKENVLAKVIFEGMPTDWSAATINNSGEAWRDLLYEFANACADECREIVKETSVNDPRVGFRLAVAEMAISAVWNLGTLIATEEVAA